MSEQIANRSVSKKVSDEQGLPAHEPQWNFVTNPQVTDTPLVRRRDLQEMVRQGW